MKEYRYSELPVQTSAVLKKHNYYLGWTTLDIWVKILKKDGLWTAEIEMEMMALLLSGGNK